MYQQIWTVTISWPSSVTHTAIFSTHYLWVNLYQNHCFRVFHKWSVFRSFHTNIIQYISPRYLIRIKYILKDMIWLVDIAFIDYNPWAIATCSFPLIFLICKEIPFILRIVTVIWLAGSGKHFVDKNEKLANNSWIIKNYKDFYVSWPTGDEWKVIGVWSAMSHQQCFLVKINCIFGSLKTDV